MFNVFDHVITSSRKQVHLAAMARQCSTLAGCLVLTIANSFLAALIIRRLARQTSKTEESERLMEKDTECAARVENVQVRLNLDDVNVHVHVGLVKQVVNGRRPSWQLTSLPLVQLFKKLPVLVIETSKNLSQKRFYDSGRSAALASPASTKARSQLCEIQMPHIHSKISPEEEALPLVRLFCRIY